MELVSSLKSSELLAFQEGFPPQDTLRLPPRWPGLGRGFELPRRQRTASLVNCFQAPDLPATYAPASFQPGSRRSSEIKLMGQGKKSKPHSQSSGGVKSLTQSSSFILPDSPTRCVICRRTDLSLPGQPLFPPEGSNSLRRMPRAQTPLHPMTCDHNQGPLR